MLRKGLLGLMLLAVLSATGWAADFTYVDDTQALAVLNRLAEELVVAGHLPACPHIGILNYDEVNAFATGSEQIFFTRKLLRLVTTEDELAAVLAHEFGHISRKIPRSSTRSFAGVDDNESRADQLGMKLLNRAQIDPTALVRVLVLVSNSWGDRMPSWQRHQLNRRLRTVAKKAHVNLRDFELVS